MAKVKIVTHSWEEGTYTMAYFICPACRDTHSPGIGSTGMVKKSVWEFNGDLNRPTFKPSLKVMVPILDGNGEIVMKTECHSYITDGRIQYLGDCTHSMAGQTVEIPDIPEDHWLNRE